MLNTNTSRPTSREEIIDFALRQLGEPVSRVNVDPYQCEDALDMALQVWREFHYDASELTYLATKVTPSVATISGETGTFQINEQVRGVISGADAVVREVEPGRLSIFKITGEFQEGETIEGSITGESAILDGLAKGSYDNRYFDVPESILSVVKLIPLSQRAIGDYMFDMRYQVFLNAIPTLTNFNLGYFVELHTHLNMISDVLYGVKPTRHSRHLNRIYLDISWEVDLAVGDTMIFEVYKYIEDDVSDLYNDWWLKRYLVGLIKKQWGMNMKKFQGVQMPGGVILNGQQIYDEAVQELEILYNELKATYHLPADFYIA